VRAVGFLAAISCNLVGAYQHLREYVASIRRAKVFLATLAAI